MAKLAMLFPGQGAQFVGMGRQLLESSPGARRLFAEANELLAYDLEAICLNGPAAALDATDQSQPGLYVTSLAAVEWLRERHPERLDGAVAAAGLSLGEYTALVFAGSLDFASGLKLVRERGLAMQAAAESTPSGMVSILGLDRPAVEALCETHRGQGTLQLANMLCPGNLVVSGDLAACQAVAAAAPAAGAMKAIPLAVAGAFHTPLMQPAVERLRAALADVQIQPPRIPVISNVDASSHDSPEEIRDLLVRQVVSPVRWEDSIRQLLEMGVDQFLEAGPGKVLRGLMKRIDRKAAVDNIEC